MKKRLLAVSLSVAILTLASVWLYFKTRPLEWHAHHILDCIEQRNADCVAGYARDHELRALGITKSTLKEVLRKELFANIVSYDTSARKQSGREQYGYIGVSEMFHMSGGSAIGIEVRAAKTEKGIKAPNIVLNAFSPIMYDKYRTQELKNSSLSLIAMKLKWAETEGSRLESEYGLKGVYKSDDEGLVTWQEYIARAREVYAEVEAKLRSVGKSP